MTSLSVVETGLDWLNIHAGDTGESTVNFRWNFLKSLLLRRVEFRRNNEKLCYLVAAFVSFWIIFH